MIETSVAGIPATIRVDRFTSVRPWRGDPQECPSDLDFYGHTEAEYTICDRRGRPAPWLERKATAADRERIDVAILEAME